MDIGIILILIAALIFASIITFFARRSMNDAKIKADANGYEKSGTQKITRSQDVFLYSTITKTEIPKNKDTKG